MRIDLWSKYRPLAHIRTEFCLSTHLLQHLELATDNEGLKCHVINLARHAYYLTIFTTGESTTRVSHGKPITEGSPRICVRGRGQ